MGLDRDAFAWLRQDFVAFDPHYPEERESRVGDNYRSTLEALGAP
jgi:hypothetical protein